MVSTTIFFVVYWDQFLAFIRKHYLFRKLYKYIYFCVELNFMLNDVLPFIKNKAIDKFILVPHSPLIRRRRAKCKTTGIFFYTALHACFYIIWTHPAIHILKRMYSSRLLENIGYLAPLRLFEVTQSWHAIR